MQNESADENCSEISAEEIVENIRFYWSFIAPNLDCYEQALYGHLLSQTMLKGLSECKVSLYSTPALVASGSSEYRTFGKSTLRKKMDALIEKSLVLKVSAGRNGTIVQVPLPVKHTHYSPPEAEPKIVLSEIDFYSDEKYRKMIIEREGSLCFYCMKDICDGNLALDHVTPRPDGNNSYMNIVACCWGCNTKKSNMPVEDFLRKIFREGLLSEFELTQALDKLQLLRSGSLLPSTINS